jgi:transposase-like protein
LTYSDEDFEKEFPLKSRKCEQCKKPFLVRFESKFCSDKCFKKYIRDFRKKIGTWIKNEKRVQSTHRPDKNWKNPT